MAREHNDGIAEFLLGMILGVAGGALLGILFAPKSGQETRQDVRAFFEDLPDKVKDDMQNPEGKTRGFFGKTLLKLEDQVGKVNKAIRAGKMAEAKKREEIASGGYTYN